MVKKTNEDAEAVKYLVSDNKGEFVVELPPGWKLTFAAVNPAAVAGGRGFGDGGYALRIWQGDKLRAVFCNVRGFRDLSIPLARKIEKQTGTAQWTMDSEGNFETSKRVTVERELLVENPTDW